MISFPDSEPNLGIYLLNNPHLGNDKVIKIYYGSNERMYKIILKTSKNEDLINNPKDVTFMNGDIEITGFRYMHFHTWFQQYTLIFLDNQSKEDILQIRYKDEVCTAVLDHSS